VFDHGPQVGVRFVFCLQLPVSGPATTPMILPWATFEQTALGSVTIPFSKVKPPSESLSSATKQPLFPQIPSPSSSRPTFSGSADWKVHGLAAASSATRLSASKQPATSKHSPSPAPLPPP
jgi:hypothetical protein